MTIDFITVSNRPENCAKLAASIPLMMGSLAQWNHTVIDGSRFDLFSGYNQGAAQTKGELLAFVHDDVQFLGNPLLTSTALSVLQKAGSGFVGVAGSRLMPASGIWWGNHDRTVMTECRGVVFHASNLDFGMHVNIFPGPSAFFGPVVVLDGVLLMCRRQTFEQLGGFDAENFKGFHFYDMDITLRASLAKLANVVVPLPLLHASQGHVASAWEENRKIFVRKFGNVLPARVQ